MKPETADLLKELLLTVYALGIYPSEFVIVQDEWGNEGVVLKR